MILYESLTWFLKRAAVFIAVFPFLCLQESSAASSYTNYLKSSSIKRDSVILVKVSGKVTDIYNKPLTDVSVSIRGKQSGMYTDTDGNYEIEIPKGSALVFSVVGYTVKEETTFGRTKVNVVLQQATLVQPSFRTLFTDTKKNLNVGAVSEIYTNDLVKTQTPSLNGLLQGRVAGLYATQTSGLPGGENVDLLLRGQTPMIWVDGVPQYFSSISPEEIESVTVMKDAVSTAMMGNRSSGGLIMITTKKGAEGPQRISVTALAGIQSPLGRAKYLNAYDYSRLYNEGLMNDGKAPVYTQADLDAYKNGTDPARHPDVNWQDQILKNNSPYNRYDISVSGGRKIARYFVNLDYLNQQGQLKTEDFNAYNTGSAYKRYTFRSNVDLDLSKSVSAFLNVYTRIQTTDQPGSTVATIFQNFRSTPNNSYPVLNSDGSLAGNQDYRTNIYGQSVYSGYRPGYYRDFRVDLGLKGNMDWLAKGLWVKGRMSVNATLSENINRSKSFAVFEESKNAAGEPVFQRYGDNGTMQNGINIDYQSKRFYTELSSGYDKQIGKHGFQALLVASVDNMMLGSDLPVDLKGLAGKVSYNFAEKYIIDAAFGYNGSQLYPKNSRYGFFPAIGLGWNIAKEDFLKDVSWLNTLKLRTSYGRTGNNNSGYYAYNQYYLSGGGANGYNFGQSATGVDGAREGQLANPNLTWEKATKLNAGFDAILFNNSLSLSADYFTDKYTDLLQTKGNSSELLGINYPLINIGKNRYSGVELQLTYQKTAGNFTYFISPNASWVQSKVLYQDEVSRKYSWMQRTGRPVSQDFGYVADGLFQNTAEISNSAVPVGITPRPGDIKYKDLNGDGVIDDNDQTAIGSTKPVFFYGLNIGGSWKGFDISALFQGVGNRTVYLSGNSYWAFQNSGRDQAYEHNLDRWTPENPNASQPRLTVGQNVNNQQTSSYWYRSANYLRLKSVEVGYSLPVSVVKKIKLSGARFFVNGYNLFTTTSLEDRDPEGYALGYPIQRLVTAGVNIKL